VVGAGGADQTDGKDSPLYPIVFSGIHKSIGCRQGALAFERVGRRKCSD
jgi:hypothetical protein